MKFLFCIHTIKNENTAVYGGYLSKRNFCRKRGWTADILTPQDLIPQHLSGRFVFLFYPLALFHSLMKLETVPDIIIFHSFAGWIFNLLRKFFPRFRNTTVITAFHGLEPLFLKRMIQEYRSAGRPLRWHFKFFHERILNALIWISAQFSDAIFCLNQEEKIYLTRHRYQVPAKIFIVDNEVGESFQISRTYMPVVKDILFVGQWQITKGTRYLIHAFSELADEDPDIHLHIVGAFQDRNLVKQDYPASLQHRITIHSEVDHGSILSHYRDADLFIFPSLSEGFSRALIEAMLTGLPVICTTAGNGADFLLHQINAWVVPLHNAEAIAEAVRQLKRDPESRERLGKAGQKIVAERFTQTNVLEKWAHLCLSIKQK